MAGTPPATPSERFQVRISPSPLAADLLFYELKDGNYTRNNQWEYGDAHGDAQQFPDHKLVYVGDSDPKGMRPWYYAAKRLLQDEYNWEFDDAGVSSPKFSTVKRTHLTLRSEFNSLVPAMGASMVNIPASKFSGTFVLADRQQSKIEDKLLDSLFVIDVQSYIQKEILTDIEPDAQSGIASQVTTTLYYRGEVVTGSSTIEALVAAPTNAFWATDALGFGRTGKQLTDNWFAVSYGKIVDLSTMWEKESNRLRPEKFYCPKAVSSSTVITANNDPGEPAAPTATSGQSVTIGKIGRIMKTKTVIQSGDPEVLNSTELLAGDGYIYPKSEELVLHSAVPAVRSNLDSNGISITFSNYDACNAIKVTEQAISIEPANTRISDKRYPERFLDDQGSHKLVETASAVVGPPPPPFAGLGSSIVVNQKGVIRTTETTVQTGNLVPLPSFEFNSSDGYLYPSVQTRVNVSTVPSTEAAIGSDGRITIYQTTDANNAIREVKQAISLKPEQRKSKENFAPAKFIPDAAVSSVEETESGVVGDLPPLAVTSQQAKESSQKGAIRTTKTTTQEGTLVALPRLDFLPSDGKTYVGQTEAIPRLSIPSVPSQVDSNGNVVEFQADDANWGTKVTRKVISTEPESRKRTSKMAPDRFYRDNQVASIEEVLPGVVSPMVMPVVALGSDVDITQKGAIRTTRTITAASPLSANKGSSLDERTGETFVESIEVVPIETVVPTFIGSDGTLITFQPLDANWSIKRTSRVASTLTKSWTQITNYEWPAVLTTLTLKVFNAKNGRGAVTYVSDRYKQGFNGPQEMQVSQYWQKDQPATVTPVNMIAEGFDYQSPLFNVRVPPCLHNGYIMRCFIGSTDPDWEPAVDVESFPPTNYTDWPEQIFWRESKPHLGGFLVTEYTINRPTP